MTHASVPPVYVGIDVAKAKLDLARSDVSKVLTVTNDPAGIRRIVEVLQAVAPTLIVVEATGGYERLLVDALLEANLPVSVVNPSKVRNLAKGLGITAKTDNIDAHVLVEFASKASPRLAEKRAKNKVELEALVTCRRQLLALRTEQSNRRQVTACAPACKAIDAVLKTIHKQADSLDAQIRKLIESDEGMSRQDEILQSVPGVGPILSATVLSELNELGTTDRQEISALVGVAPFNNDSGHFRGKRSIRGGRKSVRNVLYMAAIAAIRSNPIIRTFAQRLEKSGKLPKMIIVACMRKLLVILNAMLRDNLMWNQLTLVKNLANDIKNA